MATALWLRTIRHHRIDRQAVEPCTRDNPHDALEEACRKLDISHPIWLDKNEREWEEFGQTRRLSILIRMRRRKGQKTRATLSNDWKSTMCNEQFSTEGFRQATANFVRFLCPLEAVYTTSTKNKSTIKIKVTPHK